MSVPAWLIRFLQITRWTDHPTTRYYTLLWYCACMSQDSRQGRQ